MVVLFVSRPLPVHCDALERNGLLLLERCTILTAVLWEAMVVTRL